MRHRSGVASVIKTRARQGGLTAVEVCLQPKQFSCWNKGVKQKKRTKRELKRAKEAWQVAEDKGITHYHDLSCSPYWATKIEYIRTIGKLKFYKE